jgi:hypothetical protein
MTRAAAVLASLLLLASALFAQTKRRDALNDTEVDQLRETAQEPEKRLPLLVDFARARLAAIDQIRQDPRFADERPQRIHDLLEDFGQVMDELSDNLDDFAGKKMDLRKPLAKVIEGASEFQLKLRSLKESTDAGGGASKEGVVYRFVLQDDTESVNATLDDARKLLDEQNQAIKEAKEAKKKKK